ncbi:MAG: AbrB/MazE/SpoVT family DNA-binding domain-containing protein [Anaerolineae bacterium]|nr:AbrB/MazE/SpoVT family DNA-binding domain-containing protein [Anaerolineae bacterium]
MESSLRVQVAQRGVITLPKKIRENNKLKQGDIYTVIDLGKGVLALVPYNPRIDELADSIGDALREKGETLESMLKLLREIREKRGDSRTPKNLS